MKKITKLSLIATLALGSVSFANAQALEEAIKNVDVSGTVTYRYNDYEDTDGKDTSSSSNLYKIAVNVKSKVNDDVVANTRFIIGSDKGAAEVGLNTHEDGDAQVGASLSEVNFTYTGIANTAITFGKQGLATPFTVHRDSIGNEQTGTGIVAVTNVGPVTLAAAYFNQTNLGEDVGELSNDVGLHGDKNVVFLSAMASFAGINVDASYVDVQDFFDAYTVGLSASYDVASVKLNPYARYSSLDLDNNSADNVLWKVGMRANMGIFGAHLGYGQTDKEGGVVALDYSAETGYDEHWRVTLTGISDASVVYASVDAQVLPSLNVALKYSNLDADSKSNNTDQEEIYTQLSYQMSKNFAGYVRFGQFEKDVKNGSDIDSTMGRLHVQYSF
ncbi:porin [Malaciobacter mytili]|uniref:porin n=1 Tax=Malaciobacter mytili TaxID=603050 RepID=UPI003A88B305